MGEIFKDFLGLTEHNK